MSQTDLAIVLSLVSVSFLFFAKRNRISLKHQVHTNSTFEIISMTERAMRYSSAENWMKFKFQKKINEKKSIVIPRKEEMSRKWIFCEPIRCYNAYNKFWSDKRSLVRLRTFVRFSFGLAVVCIRHLSRSRIQTLNIFHWWRPFYRFQWETTRVAATAVKKVVLSFNASMWNGLEEEVCVTFMCSVHFNF